MLARMLRLVALAALGLALLLPNARPVGANGPPSLTLPTPPDETWKVIQGYNCGSHGGWERLSFDLTNTSGRTRGAPVYASADGTVFAWVPGSGSLLINHGGGYYTMYTHMTNYIGLARGEFIARGTIVGRVGDTGAPWAEPHLHFTYFYGEGRGASNRKALPLRFAEGYDFPDQGKCNNHYGARLTRTGGVPATISFPETDLTIEGRFAAFWHTNGKLAAFGYPISEQVENVQHFERQRFELRDGKVELGRLGVELLEAQGRHWEEFPKAEPSAQRYFAQTGHAIAPEFWGHWSSNGLDLGDAGVSERESLGLFGYPISEATLETNASGQTVLTQWFERARFEYYPDNPVGQRVLLGLLGTEIKALQ